MHRVCVRVRAYAQKNPVHKVCGNETHRTCANINVRWRSKIRLDFQKASFYCTHPCVRVLLDFNHVLNICRIVTSHHTLFHHQTRQLCAICIWYPRRVYELRSIISNLFKLTLIHFIYMIALRTFSGWIYLKGILILIIKCRMIIRKAGSLHVEKCWKTFEKASKNGYWTLSFHYWSYSVTFIRCVCLQTYWFYFRSPAKMRCCSSLKILYEYFAFTNRKYVENAIIRNLKSILFTEILSSHDTWYINLSRQIFAWEQ